MVYWFLSCSVIQFCSTAFGYYAQATAAQEIFGHTLESLRGIKYLYKWVTVFVYVLLWLGILLYWHRMLILNYRYNVFQIAFVVLAGLTFVYYAAFVSCEACHAYFACTLFPFYLPMCIIDCVLWLIFVTWNVRGGEEENRVASSNCPREVASLRRACTHVELKKF